MQEYTGSCHCGAVHFRFQSDQDLSQGLRCNCSLCQRKGAAMTVEAVAPDQVQIEASSHLGLYQFGTKTAKHYFCQQCGIYTFHETARQPGYYRFNLGCIDGVEPFPEMVSIFDGKHLL